MPARILNPTQNVWRIPPPRARLKQDAQSSYEVFGKYIHTYKFSEGVADGVVLDLVYEARDIEQRLGEQDKIDAWFEAKTKGLNDWQKAALREQWGTMQRVLSSRSRMERVVSDIDFDFSVKARLSDQRGNAILVASSIFEACKYFELFQKIADLRAKRVDYAEYLRRIARLHVRPGTDLATREAVLAAWYRQQIKDAVPSLLGTWAPRIGVAVPGFYVQQMRTRWGSSNPAAGNIRLNTELAKKSMECLEYIVVHELLHLPARTHPRRALRGADGPAHAGVAGQAGTAEPAAGEA